MVTSDMVLRLELDREEKEVIDNVIHAIYDYLDNYDEVGRIMEDIYMAEMPKGNNSTTRYNGKNSIIIIKD